MPNVQLAGLEVDVIPGETAYLTTTQAAQCQMPRRLEPIGLSSLQQLAHIGFSERLHFSLGLWNPVDVPGHVAHDPALARGILEDHLQHRQHEVQRASRPRPPRSPLGMLSPPAASDVTSASTWAFSSLCTGIAPCAALSGLRTSA